MNRKMFHLNSSLGDAVNFPTKADVLLDEACRNLGSCLEFGELRRQLRSHTQQLGVGTVQARRPFCLSQDLAIIHKG